MDDKRIYRTDILWDDEFEIELDMTSVQSQLQQMIYDIEDLETDKDQDIEPIYEQIQQMIYD